MVPASSWALPMNVRSPVVVATEALEEVEEEAEDKAEDKEKGISLDEIKASIGEIGAETGKIEE